MFSGFTNETSEFLWELSFHNERPWFQAHKEQFERCLQTPFRELAQETYALVCARFPEREFGFHISRIYRDARRLFGRGPYKDHLWFTIYCADKDEGPCFWFELSAARYAYGFGFWSPRPALMERFRRSIDANPARFERLAGSIAREKDFRLGGEYYKRPKGDRGELLDPWYNRRNAYVEVARDFGGEALTPELPQILARTFFRLMPLHDYFLEVYEAGREEERP